MVGESAAEALRAAKDRLFHIHVDDNYGQRDQHLIPGEGNFDYKEFGTALEDAGYDGFLGAELSWDYTVDPDPAVYQTLRRLNQFLGRG